jgi:hypothetical protein
VNELLIKASFSIRLGVCFASMATVLLELLLTRLFSAAAGYHFAFLIVSMAMFGMTAGALYAFAQGQDERPLQRRLILLAAAFAATLPVAYVLQGFVNDSIQRIGPFIWIATTFLLYSIPFFFSGTCITLGLTRFAGVGKTYAADLIGAGLSCPLLIAGLTYTDAQTMVSVAGLLAALSALCFSKGCTDTPGIKLGAPLAAAALNLVVLFLPQQISLSENFGKIEYCKWSPIGRVIASDYVGPALSWGKEVPAVAPPPVPQKGLFIDFGAFTVMTSGQASPAQLEPIKHDITAIASRVRPNRSLFVIGVGGGRDVLTGLIFNQHNIDGIEVNPAMVWMLKTKYGDFNGHLAEKPGVRIINDEARNWLARSQNKYDIIQCSLVDTWAASSSGAFMLTENSLYTKEAFDLYLSHLTSDGILCMLRWGDRTNPLQVLRMQYLAKSALLSAGIKNPGSHIMIVGSPSRQGEANRELGAMLVSPTAFTERDIDGVSKIAKEEGYRLLWIPGRAGIEPFAGAMQDTSVDPGMASDNRPFFFTPVKTPKGGDAGEPGLAIIKLTFIVSAILVLVVIVFPTMLKTRVNLASLVYVIRSGFYFACLGTGFMLVEVAQLQRLTILLGNPTYSLSTVLFSLLLASGIGSFVAQSLVDRSAQPRKLILFSLIASAVLVLFVCWSYGSWLSSLESATLLTRMIFAIGFVSVPGFFMGWLFPLGMTHFTKFEAKFSAWYWAINGATSVLSSISAAAISVVCGIQMTLIAGATAYLLAVLAAL